MHSSGHFRKKKNASGIPRIGSGPQTNVSIKKNVLG